MNAASQKYQKPTHTEASVSTRTTARVPKRRVDPMAKASRKYGTNPKGFGYNQAVTPTPSATSNQEQTVNVVAMRLTPSNAKGARLARAANACRSESDRQTR